ncbi:MAG: hypothetical protein ABSG53_12270 [Thermoguttaceae bacterium]|jgi:hypothetical protein
MIELVFKGNAKQHAGIVLAGAAFAAEVFFPKIRNLNRLHPGHRNLTMAKTEKYDGQNVGTQRRGNCLVFYSRNGVLDLASLGKGFKTVWDNTDWTAVHALLDESDTLYFEAVGNHPDFDYRADFPPEGYGLIAFALRKSDGQILDATRLSVLPLPRVAALEIGPLPDLQSLRRCLDSGREGFVFTGYDERGEYVAYKAKRRELLEEASDEDREAILEGDDPPEEKISKIVCTVAKVQHILQKLADGEFAIRGDGIGKDGCWDESNAILPILIQLVEDDCWTEAGDLIRDLQAEFNVPGRRINRALEDRVRSAFFELTLREALT